VDPAAVKRVERLRAQPIIDELVESRRRPLSAKQVARANAAFIGNDQDLMIDKFNIDISRRKIRGLMPGQWLNDENINFYMELLKARDALLCEKAKSEGGIRRPSHFFNSIFMGFLNTGNDYNYGKVKRWTKKIPTSIFDLRRIYCPINIRNTHWTLAVVHMDIKEIRYYDSMNGGGKMYMASLLRWLKDEANDKLQKEYDTSDWKCVPQVDIPQQHNGFDCGMFTILNCDFMSDDLPLTEESFSQKDMTDFRLKTVIKILDGELSYPLINNVLSE
jgi:Ulp1 family protease